MGSLAPKPKHTPTPWYQHPTDNGDDCDTNTDISGGPEGHTLAHCYTGYHETYTAEANAAYIVKAVNCHEELFDALLSMVKELDSSGGRPSIKCQLKAKAALVKAGAK